jgi:hypothetical protein
MPRSKIIVGTLAFGLASGLVVYFCSLRDDGTVRYHVARFNQLLLESGRGASRNPSRFRDYLRLDTLRWFLRGKPTWASDWEHEQNALLELGYFERREIVLTNRQLGAAAWKNVAVSNAFFGTNKTWVAHMDGQRPAWIRVTGTNLDEFERIIRSWDAQEQR